MKAVIMAGGEGKRLRPLTCDIPKPMARICGRPMMEYILDLLVRHHVTNASVTVKYLSHVISDHFESGYYKGLKLKFVEEETYLGTAGSVKNAMRASREPVLIISGDAMCDYDLTKAMEFHEKSGADATILTAQVEDPREYGLVCTDDDGLVTGFIEKPGWAQAVCDLANTGIYIISASCLEMIPNGEVYDFAQDLFPKMLAKGMKIAAYNAKGYWCDIGDLGAYLQCQKDVLNGKVKCNMPPEIAEGIYAQGLPEGNYQLIPPVYIGRDVDIADGAVVGPETVVDSGCNIEQDAAVDGSILLQNCSVGIGCDLKHAIVCAGARLRRGCTVFEGAVIGAKANLGADVTVKPGVLIWNDRRAESGATVAANLKQGTAQTHLFEDNGIVDSEGVELTPEVCARLGAAIGSTKFGGKSGVGHSGTPYARAMAMALSAGLISVGTHVWDFEECFEAQLMHFTAFCGLGAGIYVSEEGVRVIGSGGLPLERFAERDIASKFTTADFNACPKEKCRSVANMRSMHSIYSEMLYTAAPQGLLGLKVSVICENALIRDIMQDTLQKLGADTGDDVHLKINASGTELIVCTPDIGEVPQDKILSICCKDEFEQGRDVTLPFDAPAVLDMIAAKYGCNVERYLTAPANKSDALARKHSIRQEWVRDMLAMSLKLLSIMYEKQKPLSALLEEIPSYAFVQRTVPLEASPAKLAEILEVDSLDLSGNSEGITVEKQGTQVLIRPSVTGKKVFLTAQADRAETADELCFEIEKKLLKNLGQLDSPSN